MYTTSPQKAIVRGECESAHEEIRCWKEGDRRKANHAVKKLTEGTRMGLKTLNGGKHMDGDVHGRKKKIKPRSRNRWKVRATLLARTSMNVIKLTKLGLGGSGRGGVRSGRIRSEQDMLKMKGASW